MTFTVGDTVPAFTLPRAGGGDLTLDPGAGAATVVVFTANHCPYALAWHERLEAVGRDYADRGVTLIQVNANDEKRYPADSTAASAERVARGEFAGPYLRDLSQDVARTWARRRPRTSTSSTRPARSCTTVPPTPTTATSPRTRAGCARRSTTSWPDGPSHVRRRRRSAAR